MTIQHALGVLWHYTETLSDIAKSIDTIHAAIAVIDLKYPGMKSIARFYTHF